MELRQGRGGWGSGTGAAPQGGGHGTGCTGQWARPRVAAVQRVFGQLSDTGFKFGWSYVELGVGLDDPCEYLPTQDILCFYEPKQHQQL